MSDTSITIAIWAFVFGGILSGLVILLNEWNNKRYK